MKTATVRELRNHYSALLASLKSGEEILITQRGKPVGRLVPESSRRSQRADWSRSAAARLQRRGKPLSARASAQLRADSQGNW